MMTSKDFEYKQTLFLFTKDGQKLSFKNDNVIITDKDSKIIHQSTCYRLFAIFIVGHITITSGLIQRAAKFGFSISFLTVGFRLYHTITPTGESNTILRQKQYSYSDLAAGCALIENKIRNQRYILSQLRGKTPEQKSSIELLDAAVSALQYTDSVRSIMGVEGSASRVYFKAFFDNVPWYGRKPRIKFDMINSLLDIGYTLLFCYMDAMLAIYGFDRYCGILHTMFYMRKSLVCDMVEPFRVIIDRQVKKGINLGQFKKEDFTVINNKWQLKYEKSPEYSSVFIKCILEYKTDIFLYVREFYRRSMKGTLNDNYPMWLMEDKNAFGQL